MRLTICDENTWLFPDVEPVVQEDIHVLMARGGHAALQVYTDVEARSACLSAELPGGVSVQWYQMLPIPVEANSGPALHVTTNYDEVKDFVTRRAPFDVYDLMIPVDDPQNAVLEAGRTVLFARLAASENAAPFDGEAILTVEIGGETTRVRVKLTVSRAVIPQKSDFMINNWLNYEEIARCHNVALGSDEYWTVMDAYLDNLLELRSAHLKLPSGVPVRDEAGQVVGFDFSLCEAVAERALKKGFDDVYGGFVARFNVWDDAGQYLLWDRDVEVCSFEAYRQLKMYFTTLWKLVERHGWQKQWMQCLVDEPQFPNSMSYRALSAICRKCMPGVVIHDPVESTEVEGAMDIWCVKQAIFDKYRDAFKRLQEVGEPLTVYTCGYPAGKWMNRATDLSPLAGRLPFWMCAKEHFKGFLHWGYNAYAGLDPRQHSCYPAGDTMMPAGNGFIVYPGDKGPLHTLRSQLQLFGAEDYELLRQLSEDEMQALCAELCRNFEDYETDAARYATVRGKLFAALER